VVVAGTTIDIGCLLADKEIVSVLSIDDFTAL
jgi:hypothetical protein